MTQEEIIKAFEGRWRIKSSVPVAYIKGVRDLCLDFFQAGILIGEASSQTLPAQVDSPADTSFDYWWSLYNKKIDRAKCEKKWARLSPKDRQACIAATPAYVASTPDLQYRRHPATYLNNRSWENQIIQHESKPSIDQQRISKLSEILTG